MRRSLTEEHPLQGMDSGSTPGGVESCDCEVRILARILS